MESQLGKGGGCRLLHCCCLANFQLELGLCSGGLLEHEGDGGIPVLAAAPFVLAWRDCKFAPDSKEQRIQ